MLRVVLLERQESFNSDNTPVDKEQNGTLQWVAIGGRYNSMTTYAYSKYESNQNVFKLLHQHNRLRQSSILDEKYVYPIFLIPSDGDDSDFWKFENEPYICITRIHFSNSMDNVEQHEGLKEETYQKLNQYENVEGSLYNSIELSDAVLVLKSRNFCDLIDCALNLEGEIVGKTYTYFGIQQDHIINKNYSNDNQKIPYFSVQFSALSKKRITDLKTEFDRIFASVDSKKYKVSGIDDYAFVAQDVPLKNIEEYYDLLLTKLAKVYPCLLNATTKLGSKYKECECSDKKSFVVKQSQKILKKYEKIRQIRAYEKAIKEDINCEVLQDMDKALGELIVSLPRMASTLMLDEFVYLMIESVNAFLTILEQLITQNKFSISANIEKYQYFIEKWSHLMDHVTRAEGQLNHHPEMQPMLYDMPIIMLEYTLAFLAECTKCFNDGKNEKNCFLLIPCLCTRIEARELFNIKGIPGLVIINIPFNMLYNPKEMLKILCHEIAHFSGEKTRKRGKRIRYYAKSMASLIQSNIFEFKHPAIFYVLESRIENYLENKKDDGLYTMSKMQEDVFSWIEENIVSENKTNLKFDELVLDFYKKALEPDLKEILPLRINAYNKEILNSNYTNRFRSVCKNISILYRETYADICMIKALKLSAKDYINMHIDEYKMSIVKYYVKNDDVLIRDNKRKWKNMQRLLAVRIAICLRVSGIMPNRDMIAEDAIFDSLLKAVFQVSDMLTKYFNTASVILDDQYDMYGLPDGCSCYSLMYIEAYLKECYNSLNDSIESISLIQDMYNLNYNCEEYSKILKAIDSYRKDIIDELEKST